MITYQNLNAPDLVKLWKSIVNNNVSIGRDAHLIKNLLQMYTAEQILCGMYRMKGSGTVSIPQFVRQFEDMAVIDEVTNKIELAIFVSGRRL